MAVLFQPEDHKYISIDPTDNISWVSVTSLVSKFKKPFDAETTAAKSSKSTKSKWYGMSPEDIQKAWKDESQKAVNLGTWYHNQRESDLLECKTIERFGCALPVVKPIEIEGIKHAPDQKLAPGIYPEHFVYLKSAGICGQSDRVEIVNNTVYINDYKTNKEIKLDAYTNWEGIKTMMLPPVSNLPDCNYWHYALQLSIYMYIILKHNPKYKPGKLVIDHVIFDVEKYDQYGNRILKYDKDNNPVIKDIVHYEMPYLKQEVIAIINYLKENAAA
jgi:hypothetical protein